MIVLSSQMYAQYMFHACLVLQVKQEMQQGTKRQLALPHTEQEGSDAVEAVLDTKVSTVEMALLAARPPDNPCL